MGQLQFSPPPWRYEEELRAACPSCGGPTRRTRRRVADRLLSLARPVRRYRCESPSCGWHANRPAPAIERARRPPRTFFVGMAAMVLGLVFAAAWALHLTAFSFGDGLMRWIGAATAS